MDSWQLRGSLVQLPKSFEVDLKKFRVLRFADVPENLRDALKTVDQRLKHVCEDRNGDSFMLEMYGPSYWILWPLKSFVSTNLLPSQQLNDDNGQNKQHGAGDWSKLQFKDLLNIWREVKCTNTSKPSIHLEMEAPDVTKKSRSNIDHVDPKAYLETKYYESLFFINMPLAYFVKSNLSRLKNICKNNSSDSASMIYQTSLLELILRINEFDRRHAEAGLLRDEIDNRILTEKRKALLNKYCVSNQQALFHDLSLILKMREIKLQILIILEEIHINNLDYNFINYEDRYESKMKKRSMNITKKMSLSKHKSVKQSSEDKEPTLDYCEQLDLYLDKLCIQDILLESEPVKPNTEGNIIEEYKKNLMNKNKECSSTGFANFVLIPYYSKKAPNAVQFIIKKLKGPSLRSRRFKNKSVLQKNLQSLSSENIENNTGLRTPSILSSTPSSPRTGASHGTSRRNSIGNAQPEFLNSRTNSNFNSFFEDEPNTLRKPSFISRTASDLTMNHLQKRQLPVTDFSFQISLSKLSTNELNSARSLGPSSVTQTAGSQNSFRRVGRRKENQPVEIIESKVQETHFQEHAVQVESTPLVKSTKITPRKRAKLLNIVESPMNNIDGSQSTSTLESSNVILGTQNDTKEKVVSKKTIRRRLFAP